MHVQLPDNKRNDMLNGRRKILRLYWLAHCPDEKGKPVSYTDAIRRYEILI